MSAHIRLNIVAEGQTEMTFAKKYLAQHFSAFNISVDSRCVMTSKDKYKTYRGGLISYTKAKNDILLWIAEEKSGEPYFSTMFDLYALPNDFPKFEESLRISNAYDRVLFLEKALSEDINHRKFIPYIQLHEFEALLLANPEILLLEYETAHKEVQALKDIVATYDNNPELVNTGAETAPSKRIISLVPEYEGNKVSAGAELVGYEGIEIQKQRCKHFASWINTLEKLS
jgi:hypothetical protein